MPLYKVMDQYIESQVKFWNSRKQTINNDKKARPFITISREYGCGGFELAVKISEIINKTCPAGEKNCEWAAYDKKILEKVTEDMGISENLFGTLTADAKNNLNQVILDLFNEIPSQYKVFKKLAETVRALAINGNVILVGRAGNYFSRDMDGGFHIRVVASMDKRIERIAALKKIDAKEAEKLIIEKGLERENFFKDYMKYDLTDPENYHLTINDSRFSISEAAEVVVAALKARKLIV